MEFSFFSGTMISFVDFGGDYNHCMLKAKLPMLCTLGSTWSNMCQRHSTWICLNPTILIYPTRKILNIVLKNLITIKIDIIIILSFIFYENYFFHFICVKKKKIKKYLNPYLKFCLEHIFLANLRNTFHYLN